MSATWGSEYSWLQPLFTSQYAPQTGSGHQRLRCEEDVYKPRFLLHNPPQFILFHNSNSLLPQQNQTMNRLNPRFAFQTRSTAPPKQEEHETKLIYEFNGRLGVRGVKPSQLREFEKHFSAHKIHEEGRHAGKFYFERSGRHEGQRERIYIRPEMNYKLFEDVCTKGFSEIWVGEVASAPAPKHREDGRPPPPGPRVAAPAHRDTHRENGKPPPPGPRR